MVVLIQDQASSICAMRARRRSSFIENLWLVDGLKARSEKQVSTAVRANIDAAYQVLLGLISP